MDSKHLATKSISPDQADAHLKQFYVEFEALVAKYHLHSAIVNATVSVGAEETDPANGLIACGASFGCISHAVVCMARDLSMLPNELLLEFMEAANHTITPRWLQIMLERGTPPDAAKPNTEVSAKERDLLNMPVPKGAKC